MIPIQINILNESAGDDINIVFTCTVNGANIPGGDTVSLEATRRINPYSINQAGSISGDTLTFAVQNSVAKAGDYDYSIKWTESAGNKHTLIFGILNINKR